MKISFKSLLSLNQHIDLLSKVNHLIDHWGITIKEVIVTKDRFGNVDYKVIQ